MNNMISKNPQQWAINNPKIHSNPHILYDFRFLMEKEWKTKKNEKKNLLLFINRVAAASHRRPLPSTVVVVAVASHQRPLPVAAASHRSPLVLYRRRCKAEPWKTPSPSPSPARRCRATEQANTEEPSPTRLCQGGKGKGSALSSSDAHTSSFPVRLRCRLPRSETEGLSDELTAGRKLGISNLGLRVIR